MAATRLLLAVIPVLALAAGCGSPGTPRSAPAASSAATLSASPASSGSSPAAAASSATCGPAGVVARRMGVKRFTVYTDVTDPNHLLGRQGEYTSKVEWSTDGEGSGIEAFGDPTDARLRLTYLRMFRPPIGDGYDYLYRAAILRLASVYTPAQASAMKASFERACRGSS